MSGDVNFWGVGGTQQLGDVQRRKVERDRLLMIQSRSLFTNVKEVTRSSNSKMVYVLE